MAVHPFFVSSPVIVYVALVSFYSNFSILLSVKILSINVSFQLSMLRGIPLRKKKGTKKFSSFEHRSRRGTRYELLACNSNCGGNRKLIAPDKLINAFGRNYVRCNSAGVPAVSLERRGRGERRHEGRIENGIMDVDNERGMGDRKPPFPRSSFFLPFDPFQSSSPELVIYATRINYSSL